MPETVYLQLYVSDLYDLFVTYVGVICVMSSYTEAQRF